MDTSFAPPTPSPTPLAGLDATRLPTARAKPRGSPLAFLSSLARLDFSTTPARVRSARNLCCALGAVFFTFFIAYHGYLTHAFKIIGRDSAPSIVMAEKISHQLAVADARFSVAAGSTGNARMEQTRLGMDALNQARDLLVAASSNLTYGEEELAPLRKIARSMGSYDQAIAAAASRGYPFEMVHAASMIMRENALSGASSLDQVNLMHLERAYNQHGRNALVSALPALALGIMLFLALLWSQLDLFRRTNRALNAGYLAATVATLFFFIFCAFSMLAAEGALKIAKHDAFESVHALWLAKSVAQQAKSERALMVLASGKASDFSAPEAAWSALSEKISPLDSAGLRLAVSDSRKFGGFLGKAFANITFDGERAELVGAAKAWSSYINLPPALIIAARSEKIDPVSAQGLALMGNEAAFDEFSSRLDRAIAINQTIFDKEVDIAMGRLSPLPWLAVALIFILWGGVFFGAKPRLDEYHF
jgi:hypothetical protein